MFRGRFGAFFELFFSNFSFWNEESESVKCRFSKCRFSVLSFLVNFIFDGGCSVEKLIQKSLDRYFHSVAVQE